MIVETMAFIFAIFAALALYLTPGMVGDVRQHHQRPAIWALNLLLGWTLLGWVGALVWALTKVQHDDPEPRRRVAGAGRADVS